jgi:hypothetical protein
VRRTSVRSSRILQIRAFFLLRILVRVEEQLLFVIQLEKREQGTVSKGSYAILENSNLLQLSWVHVGLPAIREGFPVELCLGEEQGTSQDNNPQSSAGDVVWNFFIHPFKRKSGRTPP